MFDEVMGAYGSRFLLAAGGVGIALVLLIGILWILRSRAPSPFVRGGKNRQPRLQVLDAAAVDTRRRLVLVRRDDVEHLIMIGGPTDIVIESRILQDTDEGSDPAFIAPLAPPEPVVSTPEEPPVKPARPVTAFEREPEPDEPYSPAPAPAPAVEPRLHPVAITPAVAPAEQEPAVPSAATSAVAAKIEREPASPAALPPIISRPAERPAAAPVFEAANAADILDAARQRVLPQQRMEPQVSTPPAQSLPTVAEGIPVVTGDAATTSKAAPSDFERILQEEMNNTLAAQRIVPAANAPARPVPPQPANPQRRDPDMAPITGADADLQKEVARIFGEMSVNREK
ncbi:flagellar biosynthesis protein FliO [Rhizobium sp. SEMIA 4085]|uniref:flagellar biosynthetic protein FliO n=1 Tax=Rhizobium sp. SEMIA 4085 TaxID=2137761 RepID=UPI0014794EEF|nr:flagellar biosynthetic protein FliO [Rhizobium sp. SEMIA 4085]NNH29264.1 flagellar biosynthesis protein FliO [Rhizobium sp. SEMIA 4085]